MWQKLQLQNSKGYAESLQNSKGYAESPEFLPALGGGGGGGGGLFNFKKKFIATTWVKGDP